MSISIKSHNSIHDSANRSIFIKSSNSTPFKQITMKKIQDRALFFLILTSICLTSCTDKTDSNPSDECGARDIWISTSIPYTTADFTSGDRILYFEDAGTPSGICSGKIVSAVFDVTTVDDAVIPGLTAIQGKIYWGINEEKYIGLHWNSSTKKYNATLTGNLEPFFGKAPGWIGATMIFIMPSQGTADIDLNYLSSKVATKRVEIQYNHY